METEAGPTVGPFPDPWSPSPVLFLLLRRSHPCLGLCLSGLPGFLPGGFSSPQGGLILLSLTSLISPWLYFTALHK